MEHIVLNTPWWEYLVLRDLLRLSTCCSSFFEVKRHFLEWLGTHLCPCAWRRVKSEPSRLHYKSILTLRPTKTHYAASKDLLYFDHKNRLYEPVIPSHTAIMRHLRNKCCRECLLSTTRTAYSKCGTPVIVCKKCSCDPRSFSAMCDRREIAYLNGGMRGYRALLKKLHVCKIGGNRAFLYWRIDVMALLCDKHF